jgi:hypothetical protein
LERCQENKVEVVEWWESNVLEKHSDREEQFADSSV